jgi:hypothetical protein
LLIFFKKEVLLLFLMRRIHRNDRSSRRTGAGQKNGHHQPRRNAAESMRRAGEDAARMSERHVERLLAVIDAYPGMQPDATVNLLNFGGWLKDFACHEAPLTVCE